MGSVGSCLVFSILVMSLLLETESLTRWKVIALAILSILVNGVLHELLPGLLGAMAAVLVTVALVGIGLVGWCELERRTATRILAAYFGCSLVVNLFSALLDNSPA